MLRTKVCIFAHSETDRPARDIDQCLLQVLGRVLESEPLLAKPVPEGMQEEDLANEFGIIEEKEAL
jgi:hypothetical protein